MRPGRGCDRGERCDQRLLFRVRLSVAAADFLVTWLRGLSVLCLRGALPIWGWGRATGPGRGCHLGESCDQRLLFRVRLRVATAEYLGNLAEVAAHPVRRLLG